MNPLLLGPLFEIGKSIIDRLVPDVEGKAKAELELVKMAQEGGLQQVLAQLQINAKEAEHESIFVAGWRPFVGWICGVGFLYAAILHSVLSWLAVIYGIPVPPPIDSDILLYVLGGMLGLGALRTVDKKHRSKR